jgi:hypothetical protein
MVDDLDMLADTLNELYERAEGIFRQYRVAAMVPGEGGYLAFKIWTTSKTTREWRLVWVGDGGGQPSLLRATSRQIRIKAVEVIPALHRALLEQRAFVTKTARDAIEELEAYLDKLEAEGG